MSHELTQDPRRDFSLSSHIGHLLAGFTAGILAYGAIVIAIETAIPGNHFHGNPQNVAKKDTLELIAMSTPLFTMIYANHVARTKPIEWVSSIWSIIALALISSVGLLADAFILFLAAMAGYC